MKLWILGPGDPNDDLWGYDCAHGFVVRAPSEMSARHIAAENCGDERGMTWLDQVKTTCKVLAEQGDHGVILREFLHG